MSIVAFVSGHGFGHLAQITPLLHLLKQRFPDWPLYIRSSLSPEIINSRLHVPCTLLAGEVDVGVVQQSAICEDWLTTGQRAADFFAPALFAQRVQAEAERLAALKPRLVLSDISPLAFPVADALDLPSVAIANLDWHDIYQPVLQTTHPEVLQTLTAAHARADLLLRMPWHLPMQTFPRIVDIPLLPQPCRISRQKVRQQLGLCDEQRTVVLVLFGGTPVPAMDLQALADMREYLFLFFSWPEGVALPVNVRSLDFGKPFSSRVVMHGCDLVLCKPGYGVLSEAWNEGIPVVYAPRPGFAEYACMHDWLQQHAPAVLIDEEALRTANWRAALVQAQTYPHRWPTLAPQAEQAMLDAMVSLL